MSCVYYGVYGEMLAIAKSLSTPLKAAKAAGEIWKKTCLKGAAMPELSSFGVVAEAHLKRQLDAL